MSDPNEVVPAVYTPPCRRCGTAEYGHDDRLRAVTLDRNRLRDIVRDLADEDPIVYHAREGVSRCVMCDTAQYNRTDIHDAACPWRRAKEIANG